MKSTPKIGQLLPVYGPRFIRERSIVKGYALYRRVGLPKMTPVFAYQYRREWRTS